jgi:predicted transcriptional regulator
MAYSFPPDLERLVRDEMSAGVYPTEDDLLRDAISALRGQREDVAAVRAGIADMEAGRVRPFQEVAAEIRSRRGFADE